jgi:hypothetical protein
MKEEQEEEKEDLFVQKTAKDMHFVSSTVNLPISNKVHCLLVYE